MKKLFVYGLLSLLVLSVAFALTWQKIGSVYVVTLNSGNKINVTNIVYSPSNKNISATIKYDALSPSDLLEIANFTESVQDQIDGKKNNYTRINIIWSKT